MKQKVLCVVLWIVFQHNYPVAQNVFNPSDSIITYNPNAPRGSASNPLAPSNGSMVKWIRTVADPNLISWNTSQFKCYFGANLPFRLRFPNNYNPSNPTKYPIVVFFHGGGESRPATDNELHLFLGAQLLEQFINDKKWNGFLLFSQIPTVEWSQSQIDRTNTIVDTLVKYLNVDGNKAIAVGLSSGGNAAVVYTQQYPKRVVSCVTSSPSFIRGLSNGVSKTREIPTWMGHSGRDKNPSPFDVIPFTNSYRDAGGSIYTSYFAAFERQIWNLQWNQKDAAGNFIFLNYLNGVSKSQPIAYYQNTSFCSGSPVSAKMGLTPGFSGYQWEYDNGSGFTTITGARSNEFTATQPGKYRARVRPTASSNWLEWSPKPITISVKNCAADTIFTEGFERTNPFYFASSAYKPGTFDCQNGIYCESALAIVNDGTGTMGRRFLLHNTTTDNRALCNYTTADQTWRTAAPPPVTPNTTYELSFSLANQADVNSAKIIPRINFTNLTNTAAFAIGDGIWRKFIYSWNSGPATTADIDFINQNSSSNGNDFAIDEITLTKKGTTVTTCPLPTSISTIDIGAVAQSGSGCFTAPSNYLLKGSGADIWGSADGFRYVYKNFSGNGSVDVKVSSQDNTNAWNKAGVMIRESLSNGAPHVYMALTSSNGAAFQYRSFGNGISNHVGAAGSEKAPYYVRLERTGNTFTGSISSDGVNWQQVGSTTIPMSATAYAGLAVTSHDNSILSTVSFDDWRINNAAASSAARTGTVNNNTQLIRITPNPAPENFVINFTVVTRQNITLQITGADGRVFYKERISNFTGIYRKNFGSLHLSKSIYAVTLTGDEGSKTTLLVKE